MLNFIICVVLMASNVESVTTENSWENLIMEYQQNRADNIHERLQLCEKEDLLQLFPLIVKKLRAPQANFEQFDNLFDQLVAKMRDINGCLDKQQALEYFEKLYRDVDMPLASLLYIYQHLPLVENSEDFLKEVRVSVIIPRIQDTLGSKPNDGQKKDVREILPEILSLIRSPMTNGYLVEGLYNFISHYESSRPEAVKAWDDNFKNQCERSNDYFKNQCERLAAGVFDVNSVTFPIFETMVSCKSNNEIAVIEAISEKLCNTPQTCIDNLGNLIYMVREFNPQLLGPLLPFVFETLKKMDRPIGNHLYLIEPWIKEKLSRKIGGVYWFSNANC